MIHTARQLKDLVRNKSKSDSKKAQSLIRIYCMERFLERLSVSPYAPKKITIDKTTGKVTLKKGLKKGTYKVKVQAYLVNPWHGQIISENQAIKIKVKK